MIERNNLPVVANLRILVQNYLKVIDTPFSARASVEKTEDEMVFFKRLGLVVMWVCTCLVTLPNQTVSIAQNDQFTITLSLPITVEIGDSAFVIGNINCPGEICGAFALTLDFDPAVIQVVRADLGPYLGEQVIQVENAVNNDEGKIRLAAATVGPSAASPEMPLFSLEIVGQATGLTEITISELILGDLTGAELPAEGVGGSVMVIAAAATTASPQPTVTLTPTELPTETLTPTIPATITPTPMPTTTPIPAGFELIDYNEDWTPVLRSFDGVEMVLVPIGCFLMGSEQGAFDEQPVSEQCFDQPFWIDRYEVTNAQFMQFNGSADQPSNSSRENQPRDNVSWTEAQAFCLTRHGRLPTEREWEYAARGPDGLPYAWGDEFKAEQVVYGIDVDGQSADVGSITESFSWVGAYDMNGNVGEWVNSVYADYPYQGSDGREDTNDLTSWRVVRGGTWFDSDSFMLRSAVRLAYDPNYLDAMIGFRCIRPY